MPYSKMEVVPDTYGHNYFSFQFSETLSSPGNGTAILIPSCVKTVACTLSFTGGGTGKVQTTTSSIQEVQTGIAVWVDWDMGTVSATSQDVCVPVTAVRLVQVHVGTATISVRAQ